MTATAAGDLLLGLFGCLLVRHDSSCLSSAVPPSSSILDSEEKQCPSLATSSSLEDEVTSRDDEGRRSDSEMK
jgi:hypothetical protein